MGYKTDHEEETPYAMMMVEETAAAKYHVFVSESSACAMMARTAAAPAFQSQPVVPCVSSTHHEEMDVVHRQCRRSMCLAAFLEEHKYTSLVCLARLLRSWSPEILEE